MIVADTRQALHTALEGRSDVALVPTMGALHAGHRALLDAARVRSGLVVASIFVNPLQFGAGEDLSRYPRSLAADLSVCDEAGVDVVFTPDVETVYPGGEPLVTIEPGALAVELEGVVRPGHFRGVLTVVAKLFGLARPGSAFFGEKDYQQLVLVRQMVSDLCMGIDIIGVPTVRESDGLALSSRNGYLSAADRTLAATLAAALRAGRDAGGTGPDGVIEAARDVVAAAPAIQVDYLALRAPDLGPAPDSGSARLLVAARVGNTRLIDNVAVSLRTRD